MASLFNNESSLLLRVLCRVITEIHDGKKPFTKKDVISRLHDAFPGGSFFSTGAEQEIIDTLLPEARDGSGALRPFYDAPVPSLPSLHERLWLKTMLRDESAAFLLPGSLREKLLARLEDTPDFPLSGVWEKRQAKGDSPAVEPLRSRLALVWRALCEKRKSATSISAETERAMKGISCPAASSTTPP